MRPIRHKDDPFSVECKVCTQWNSNEDSILMVEKPDHRENVWCCKVCSAKMEASLKKHCVFCDGWTVENLYIVDGKEIPVCWSCDMDLER